MARRGVPEEEELNLVPIMNMVSILIPFLLMAAQFVQLAVIDSTLPAISDAQTTPPDPNEKPPLGLSILITEAGLSVVGNAEVLKTDAAVPEGEKPPPNVPCKGGGECRGPESYSYGKLTQLLAKVKNEHPDEENVILVPDNFIPYEVLVMVMDATREDVNDKDKDNKSRSLFPYVVIAGGVQ